MRSIIYYTDSTTIASSIIYFISIWVTKSAKFKKKFIVPAALICLFVLYLQLEYQRTTKTIIKDTVLMFF